MGGGAAMGAVSFSVSLGRFVSTLALGAHAGSVLATAGAEADSGAGHTRMTCITKLTHTMSFKVSHQILRATNRCAPQWERRRNLMRGDDVSMLLNLLRDGDWVGSWVVSFYMQFYAVPTFDTVLEYWYLSGTPHRLDFSTNSLVRCN
eukprot:2720813-Rhodomonas_salina.1